MENTNIMNTEVLWRTHNAYFPCKALICIYKVVDITKQ
jgi:hypothetical protein